MFDGDACKWRREGFEVIAQRGAGLEERLASAFEDVDGPALLVGMDTPQLTSELLVDGLHALATRGYDAVLGPALDGGYWSVGLAHPNRAVFTGVPMSVPSTLRAQRSRLSRLGLRVHEQRPLRDVDTIDDARAVACEAPESRFASALAAMRMTHPLRLYADGLLRVREPGMHAQARLEDGTVVPLALERYVGPADETDEQILRAVRGPVLDVGCGPGRHLHALARRGVFALGVDLSPVAVELARGGGGRAIVGSIFDELPGAGTWHSALLLDGNIGIGGAPARLLERVRALLADGGAARRARSAGHPDDRDARAAGDARSHERLVSVGAGRGGGHRFTRPPAAASSPAHRGPHGGRWFARLRKRSRRPPVERDVPIQARPGEPLRPASLRVDERELPGDRPERSRERVVEHPCLERDAAAGGREEPQRPRLLGVIDQRSGADQPVAAGRRGPRHDPVAVRVT